MKPYAYHVSPVRTVLPAANAGFLVDNLEPQSPQDADDTGEEAGDG
jgi:hypothetical protein